MSVATRPAAPSVGGLAPDATPRDASGSSVHLGDLWSAARRALVLVFVRHFG